MAQWTPDNLRVKGALTAFHQAMDTVDPVWSMHCQTISSTTNAENHNFPGFLPVPRQFLDSRSFQNMRDFTYNVENNEYELSMIINRTHWEDDQTGLINQRMTEMGEAWATYKDSLFADLLAAGNVSGNNGFDGATFHQDSRTIGSSGTIDNNQTSNITATAAATSIEAMDTVANARTTFLGFNDDQGRPFNSQAVKDLRAIVPPGHFRGFMEAMEASTVDTGNSAADNVFGRAVLSGVDELPYLSATAEVFFSALGQSRKPFIYQERTPLEIIMKTNADDVAENNGILVLTRQRFIMTYGEPRRSILHTFT